MQNLKRFSVAFLPLIIFIVLACMLMLGLKNDPRRVPSALLDKSVPQFQVNSLQSDKLPLSNKDFLGHISLLNIWATWCVTCRVEHPYLMDIAKDKDIVLYGLDYKDDKKSALQWLKSYGDPYTKIGFDETGDIAIDFGVYGTPETFVIDKKGVIRYKLIGAINQQKWDEKLLPVIEKLKRET